MAEAAEPLESLRLHPASPKEDLHAAFVGRDLRELPGPQAIIDVAAVRRNCESMLYAASSLQVGFRAHVKTHKTLELTRFQVGGQSEDVNLIVSTIAEAEFLLPLLLEWTASGKHVNVLYGIPPSAHCARRLRLLGDRLGPLSISFLIDHPAQLNNLSLLTENGEEPVPVMLKADSGYHRAGLPPDSAAFETLLRQVAECKHVQLQGFYSHNSLSYNAGTPTEALEFLEIELETVAAAASKAAEVIPALSSNRFLLSVGASPSVTSAQNLLASPKDPTVARLLELIHGMKQRHNVELHAGVYPVLDLQQLATNARPLPAAKFQGPTMSAEDIGIFVLAEVLSLYPAGSRGDKAEALIGAGTLGLGREPCKSYPGWGIVAPWPGERAQIYSEHDKTGWIVGRISQEHGILTWEGNGEPTNDLQIGQMCLIYPNHACIASAGFDWYLVVDGSSKDIAQRTKVVDVWLKARGW